MLAVGVGFAFALLHALFYQFGLFQAPISLSFLAVLGLFLVGTLRNLLILTHGHIAFAWAIHFAWNFHMFNSSIQTSSSYWGEAERFNKLLGTWEFLAAAALGIGLVFVLRRVKGIQE